MLDRTRKEFSDDDVAEISGVYHAWREGKGYEDVSGFCKAAKLKGIWGHNYTHAPKFAKLKSDWAVTFCLPWAAKLEVMYRAIGIVLALAVGYDIYMLDGKYLHAAESMFYSMLHFFGVT